MNSITCPACGETLPEEALLDGIDRLRGTPGRFWVRVCARCGSGRTVPLVPSDQLESLYAGGYTAHGLPRNPALRLVATLLYRVRYSWALKRGMLRVLRNEPPGRLLDVGSGRGDLGVVLGGRGWHVTGLDPSEKSCAEARSRGVPSECGTLTSHRDLLPTGSYDVIVFQHSLEHLAEPSEDLAVARTLLRGGGRVILSVPGFGSWQRTRFGSYWYHLDLPRHRSHFSRRGLELLLRRTGFGDAVLSTSSSADGLPMSLQYRLFGRRRFDRGPALYATIAVILLMLPVTAALNALRGGGDVLNAVAFKRGDGRDGAEE